MSSPTNRTTSAGACARRFSRANADPGSNTITFDPAVTGTITLTSGQIQIAGPMTIVGPGAGTLTVDANANNRIFSVFADRSGVPRDRRRGLPGVDLGPAAHQCAAHAKQWRRRDLHRAQPHARFNDDRQQRRSAGLGAGVLPTRSTRADTDDHELAVHEQQGATDRASPGERFRVARWPPSSAALAFTLRPTSTSPEACSAAIRRCPTPSTGSAERSTWTRSATRRSPIRASSTTRSFCRLLHRQRRSIAAAGCTCI